MLSIPNLQITICPYAPAQVLPNMHIIAQRYPVPQAREVFQINLATNDAGTIDLDEDDRALLLSYENAVVGAATFVQTA